MITSETIIINDKEIPSAEMNRLLAAGQKAETIAYIVKQTGMGLKEAKNLVDNLSRHKVINDTIVINNKEIPAGTFYRLLAEEKKPEAIAYIVQQTGMDLKNAKDIVENFSRMSSMMNEGRTSYHQKARATKINNKITVRYTDDSGRERVVTPADAAWSKVKDLMRDNDMIKEYEQSFQRNNNETQIDVALSQSGATQQSKTWKRYLIIALLVILAITYFVLK